MKGRRVTIVIDADLDKKIRDLQAKAIRDTNGSVSYSRVINKLLRDSIKK